MATEADKQAFKPGDVALQQVDVKGNVPVRRADERPDPFSNYDRNQKWTDPDPDNPDFKTALSPEDELAFQVWRKKNKVPFDDSPTSDYDMRGFWKAGQEGDPDASTAVSKFDGKIHFNDKFKTPFHKSFSNESQYATSDAPHWVGDRLVDKDGNTVIDETPPGKTVAPAPDKLDQVERATLVKLPAPDLGERGAPIPQAKRAELVDPDPDSLYTEPEVRRATTVGTPDLSTDLPEDVSPVIGGTSQPEVRRAAVVGTTPKAQLVTPPPEATLTAPKPRVSEFGYTPEEYKAAQEAPITTAAPTSNRFQPDTSGGDTSGQADYFRKRGDAPITNENDPRLTQVGVGNQKWTVHKEAAPYFQGFLNELADQGAPLRSDGGWNFRQKVGAKGLSEHSWAGAIDVNQDGRDQVSPQFQRWLQANPGALKTAEQHWHIYGGERFGDLGHFEWGGIGGDTGQQGQVASGDENYITGRATTFGYKDKGDPGVGAPRLGQLSTNNQDLVGVAIPEGALREFVSAHPADWRKARVEVVTQDGRSIMVPIVDLGPHDTSDKRGVVADFTQGLTNLLGNTGDQNYKFRIIPNAGPDVTRYPQAFADEQAAIKAGLVKAPSLPGKRKPGNYVLTPVNQAEQASADTAAQFGNQGQRDNLSILADQTPNLGALIKRLDQPVDGVSDQARKDYQDQIKKEATVYAQEYYGEPDAQKAYDRITSNVGPVEFTGEILSKIIPNFGKADVAVASVMDLADEKRVKQFIDALGPNASQDVKTQEMQRLVAASPEERGPLINELISHADSTTAQAIGDPGSVLDSLNRISDPNYQAKRKAAIAEKQNWVTKSLRTDPRMVGTTAEFVTQQLAALPKNVVESMLPPVIRETVFYAELYKDAKDNFARDNPEMSPEELDQKANLSAIAQLLPQEVLMAALGGKLGAIASRIENPVARVATSALAHTAIGAAASGTQQIAANVVADKPTWQGVPEAFGGGAIQSVPGGLVAGVHRAPVEVRPQAEAPIEAPPPTSPPEPAVGPHGAPARGPRDSTLQAGAAEAPPP